MENYRKADLENVLNVLSVLYVLEYNFMKIEYTKEDTVKLTSSRMFRLGVLEKSI